MANFISSSIESTYMARIIVLIFQIDTNVKRRHNTKR